jgi:ferritin-like metal-binding protein YciE
MHAHCRWRAAAGIPFDAPEETATMATRTSNHTTHRTRTRKKGLSHSSLEDLFIEGLLDVYSAEKEIESSLPELTDAAWHEELYSAFRLHTRETAEHISRLEKIFSQLNVSTRLAERCPAVEGLVKEARKIIDEYEKGAVRDSALIIAAQKIEHYEIACYGSLCELSDVLGYWNICDLLGRTLDNEEKTDLSLSEIAVAVNDHAHQMNEKQPDE